LLVACGLARLWGAALRRGGRLWPALLAALALAVLAPTLLPTSAATASLRRYARESPRYRSAVDAVRRCAAPDDRVAAFPCYPRFYMDTGRLPAAPSVFYLPWQEAWDRQRSATWAGLWRNRPKAVLVQEALVWGIPWRVYGRDIDDWLAQGYLPVTREPKPGTDSGFQLFVRKDAAADFARCAGPGLATAE